MNDPDQVKDVENYLIRSRIPVGANGADGVFDIKNDGVGVGKFNAEGEKYADQIQKVQDQIKSGEITDIPDTVK